MTTPTTNFGWAKPDPTEYATVGSYNTPLESMDASIKTKSNTVVPIIKAMGKWGIIKSVYTVIGGSATPKLLNDTSAAPIEPFWKELWLAEGSNAGSFTFTTSGFLTFGAAGIYRLSYNIGQQVNSSIYEGWQTCGLYRYSDNLLVPRTLQSEQMLSNTSTYYQTLSKSTYIRVTTGGDAVVSDGTDATKYCLGIRQAASSNTSNITRRTSLDPYFSSFTLEYVRAL